jgi:hypothetical protein
MSTTTSNGKSPGALLARSGLSDKAFRERQAAKSRQFWSSRAGQKRKRHMSIHPVRSITKKHSEQKTADAIG